jgi:hypothetical protein
VLSVPWGTVDDTRAALDSGNAFMDSVTADREGIRLNLWSPAPAPERLLSS